MAQQTINIGSAPNDHTGDTIRDSFDKTNDNFTELYAADAALGTAAPLDIDTDGTLAANSDALIATQKAVKTAIASAVVGLFDPKGTTDCSANPNYPAALKGDVYLVSVAGKIGGASGKIVTAGDVYIAFADNAGGTEASVGTSWSVVQNNITYAPVDRAGDTMTGDLIVPDEAYDATGWDGSLEVPTKNAVRDKIEALAGGGFTAASTTEQLTGTDSAKGSTSDSVAALWEQGADVASAGTTSLDEGGYFHITGTTTITDIDFATDKAGRKAWVEFTGILTLTHNASTLILPTGANITTAAGDTACFVSEGSDVVRCVAYNRASGAALVGGSTPALTLISTISASGSSQVADFTSIAATYRDLIVVVRGRSARASSLDSLNLTVNGLTTSIYDRQRLYNSNLSTATTDSSLAQSALLVGLLAGDTAAAGHASTCVIEIYDYAGTTFEKQVLATNNGAFDTTHGLYNIHTSGNIRLTSAINQVTLTSLVANFKSGSIISLYGRM